MKKTLLKSSLIVPALGLFVLGGVATGTAFADELVTSEKPERGFFQHQELTDEQKAVHEEARALREAGDLEGAQAVLEAAGISFPKKTQ